MKKLIIAAAIAAGALVSQAASFDWVASSKSYSISADTITAGLTAGHFASATSGNANTMSNQITSFGATWAYEITLTSGSFFPFNCRFLPCDGFYLCSPRTPVIS